MGWWVTAAPQLLSGYPACFYPWAWRFHDTRQSSRTKPRMTPFGMTSCWVAAARAIETESPMPLFVDPFARELAGEIGFELLSQLSRPHPQFGVRRFARDPYLSVRTRYFDDTLIQAVRELSIRQIVLLGAGMDTRAFRLRWPVYTVVYELDRRDVFASKEAVLRSNTAISCCERRVINNDVTTDWVPSLVRTGFDPSMPSAFVLEGFLMYLAPDTVERVMSTISTIAAPSSWICADVPNPELLTSPLTTHVRRRLRELGTPFLSSMACPATTFGKFGWRATVVSPGDECAHFGLWPFATVPKSVPLVPRVFFVTAKRLDAPSDIASFTSETEAVGPIQRINEGQVL